jgi:hypothetical protein
MQISAAAFAYHIIAFLAISGYWQEVLARTYIELKKIVE